MRNARKVITNLSLAIVFVGACAASAGARTNDDRVISARAGGVNFVSGEVTLRRAGRDAWQQLATTDELKAGDAVRTGADGRAEILLNPGSYLRLGENAEFELTDPSLDSLRLKLSKGSALVEAAGYSDADVALMLDTPRAPVLVVRSGVYRVNVGASGATEVFVRKGRALVGMERTLLKEGMFARLGAAGVVEVAKFDRDERDALDVWGKSRAREMARAQSKLQRRQVNAALARAPWDAWGMSSGLFGVWYHGGSCYTFLPFYFYQSPYGYSYDMELPAFAYLCGSCHRRLPRPWGTAASNPAPVGNGVTTQTQ
ncbi:MAG: FecR domain-containing protein, partial [Acidobacteria bacterium]|nr:FecR domain-containing protein [Acidobacteriota bacterium]